MIKKVDKVACPSKDNKQKKWFITNWGVFLKVKHCVDECQNDDEYVDNWNRYAENINSEKLAKKRGEDQTNDGYFCQRCHSLARTRKE